MDKTRIIAIVGGLIVVALISTALFLGGKVPDPISVDTPPRDDGPPPTSSPGIDPVDPPGDRRTGIGRLMVDPPEGYVSHRHGSGTMQQIALVREGAARPDAVVALADSPSTTTAEYVNTLAGPTADGERPTVSDIEIAGEAGKLIEFEITDMRRIRYVAVAVIDGMAVTVTAEGAENARGGVRSLVKELADNTTIE